MNLRKLFPRSSNIYETFKPFYYALKACGLTPFTFDQNGEVMFGFSDFIMMTTSLLWLIYCFVNNLRPRWSMDNHPEILANGWQMLLILEIYSTFVIILMNFFKRKTIGKILKKLHQVDENLNMEGVCHSTHCLRSILAISGCSFVFLIVLVFAIQIHGWNNMDMHLTVSYVYISQSYNFIIYQFLFGAYCVKTRFQCINANLE